MDWTGHVFLAYSVTANSSIAEMKAHAVDRFSRELIGYKEELETGKLKAEHKELYDTFFIITTTPVRGMKVSIQQPGSEPVHKAIYRIPGAFNDAV
ncbi:MAG: hypothetical protein ABFC84_03630 [Veillonellales bacterium]